MLVGEHKGMMVQEAKPLLRATLVADGRACLYSEPEKKVMSRSGEECVVALTDQWYTTPRYEAVANRNVWVCRGGQKRVLGRGANPKRSRRACSPRYGLCRNEPAGVAKRPRAISHPKPLTLRFAACASL
jgi:hypothetical protein